MFAMMIKFPLVIKLIRVASFLCLSFVNKKFGLSTNIPVLVEVMFQVVSTSIILLLQQRNKWILCSHPKK